MQTKYNKLQKINAKNKWFFTNNKCKSANMGSSSVDLIDIQIQNGSHTHIYNRSFFFLVLALFSEQLWLFNGQVDDSTVGDYILPT